MQIVENVLKLVIRVVLQRSSNQEPVTCTGHTTRVTTHTRHSCPDIGNQAQVELIMNARTPPTRKSRRFLDAAPEARPSWAVTAPCPVGSCCCCSCCGHKTTNAPPLSEPPPQSSGLRREQRAEQPQIQSPARAAKATGAVSPNA